MQCCVLHHLGCVILNKYELMSAALMYTNVYDGGRWVNTHFKAAAHTEAQILCGGGLVKWKDGTMNNIQVRKFLLFYVLKSNMRFRSYQRNNMHNGKIVLHKKIIIGLSEYLIETRSEIHQTPQEKNISSLLSTWPFLPPLPLLSPSFHFKGLPTVFHSIHCFLE